MPGTALVKKPSMVVQNFTIREGLSLKLNNVYYNYNDASIRPDAAKDLNALYSVMIKYPDMEVELSAHTDARGTADYNDELSQRRAESAVQYLVNRGIDAQRITAKGYGERRLRNHCGDGVFCSDNGCSYRGLETPERYQEDSKLSAFYVACALSGCNECW